MIGYFDLFRAQPALHANAPRPTDGPMGLLRQFVIYLGLGIGVLIEPIFPIIGHATLTDYLDALALPRAIGAAIIALLLFPLVYRRALDPEQPVLAQASTVLAAGIGWRSVLEGLAQATGLGS